LVLRPRRDEWIIALPSFFNNSARQQSGRHRARELDSAFRQNFDEISPGINVNASVRLEQHCSTPRGWRDLGGERGERGATNPMAEGISPGT
jgi:hypothetical protein